MHFVSLYVGWVLPLLLYLFPDCAGTICSDTFAELGKLLRPSCVRFSGGQWTLLHTVRAGLRGWFANLRTKRIGKMTIRDHAQACKQDRKKPEGII